MVTIAQSVINWYKPVRTSGGSISIVGNGIDYNGCRIYDVESANTNEIDMHTLKIFLNAKRGNF